MRILLVSTVKRNVTESTTASRSRIIFTLSQGLAKRGHEVSLLGTGDSVIDGVDVIPVTPKGWVDLPNEENPFFLQVSLLIQLAQRVKELQNDFDVIHNHTYPEFFLPLIENDITVPFVTTVHSQGTDYIDNTLCTFHKSVFVALSNGHKKGFKKTHFETVIYNGIDTNSFSFSEKKNTYFLWIGRLSKAKDKAGNFLDPKGIRHAIALAKRTGKKLKLAGNVEDQAFFDQDVKPYLNDKIEWVGLIGNEQNVQRSDVVKLMQGARAFLMTVNWEEPFGLVMAEAMSCGTPVIAFDRGAVSEIVVDTVTGYVVDPITGINGLVTASKKLDALSHEEYTTMIKAARKRVEENFTIEKMVDKYEMLYKRLCL
ncbi:hypothetical protein A3D80_01465 [Candidatus Roizmanbacteria bacterium RIFCSPHIGHO2_02_FULL_40_13b]|uniref:Glycosyl transferase family 1 domain-containing protein n=1 Tax=Candidatus Roizmanbacteria bacterium RIFCSPHIGHO2_01_FULL_39_24 TaxID=1802032 RepID=A0A1F7GIU5_9BACT|nr:MAG: hypothetical protein A2799_00740 [Candidatus Roizmanbacteria bacterium RIFCSPHIGHO2_01_FULL_39_24]OGK26123.1 MAG: hypothetical protein A3D80_01465 [Candidatus Roizmanbacteria bacterium RIFCSPHIGHO2_02_FULL_40_13b]OGK49478.1 MAG: hypothetical protein A3A56_00420 [Candidatus Roizmanbacteria bacterium RIFCSPLOWO2_01_FULL_40_32]OGK57234.1 MAG: hypothetical protein A3H83_03880 [Candidatus Roizmanbacteria bacterium RIFCSPLOWO2_02_FULL_39_8]